MPYYEVIYENGQHSVMCAEDDEETYEALTEQQRRAVAGEAGGPDGRPASRISRVYKYEAHPDDWNVSQELSAKDAAAAIKDSATAPEMIAALTDAVHPQVESGPHESNYKMTSSEELDAAKWGGE